MVWYSHLLKNFPQFRYDLNKISDKYAVQVMNKFKGLDLVNSVPEELWMEVHNIVQEEANKTMPKKKKGKKQSGYLRRFNK